MVNLSVYSVKTRTNYLTNKCKMERFNIELIKTDVTSLKIYENFLLAGIGSQLHIYDLKDNLLLHKETLFDGLRIHGIEINPSGSHILLNAENELLLLKTSFNELKKEDYEKFLSIDIRVPIDDWILSTKWLQYNNFVIVTMHNTVEFYNNETMMLAKNSCDTKCILYCSHIAFDTLRDCVVFSGTVFSEILVWKPYYSGEVLHRLKGHEGVLFSITYLNSHILSTSDDRSVTLWHIDGNLQETCSKITIKHKLHGHTARVFAGKILTDYLLSAGEDGRVNIWDFNGKLLKTFNVHHGGSVWSLECDETRNFIISGGSDSSIARLPLSDNWQTMKIKISDDEVPKKLVIMHNGDVVIITESGLLMHYIKKSQTVVQIGSFNEFKSYALLEISQCRRNVVLAGLNGHIRVYSLLNEQLVQKFEHCIPNKERIFSIHWLTCEHLLSCGPGGMLYLWKLHKPSEKLLKLHPNVTNGMLLTGVYQLPPSKERWSTSACRIPNNGIAVGDRKGNLHLFHTSDTSPSHTIRRAHSHLGITQLYWDHDKNVLTSYGRNSTIRNYHVTSTSQLVPITSDVLPFSWLGSKHQDENVILGFSGNEMLLWDYDKRLELYKTNCGGGHRSWDFYQEDFIYIRDKAVNSLKTSRPIELTSSIHSTEINAMKCLKFDGKTDETNAILFISGGEDTTLRFSTSRFSNDVMKLVNVSTIKSHLSSIRCLHVIPRLEHTYNLVTAGGRGQIIYWLLTLNENAELLFCKELYSLYEEQDEEIRVMDLCSAKINKELFLFAACSDGSVKIYILKDDKVILHKILFYKLRCMLKLCVMCPPSSKLKGISDDCLLVTMATNGYLSFWDLTKLLDLKDESSPFHSIQAHLSGINAFDYKFLGENKFCFLSGGDDNQITLFVFRYSQEEGCLEVIYSYKNVESHCAQITGVHLSDRYFFTCCLDQKLLMFEYDVENKLVVNYKAAHSSTISDVKGICVFDDNERFDVVLYGLGLELLSLKL